MGSGSVDVLDALDAVVDQVLDLDLERLSGAEQAALFAGLERHRNRMVAVDHVIVAHLQESNLAGEFGRASTADLMVDLVRIAPAEAKARVSAARDMGPRRQPCGLALEPIFARVAAAQGEGAISAAHARVVTKAVSRIPGEVAAQYEARAEEFLVDAARDLDPKRLQTVADRFLATIDPDGPEPSEEDQQRRRSLALGRVSSGFWKLDGWLTEECAAIWSTVLDALCAPAPSVDGLPDDRTPAQRAHDGLLDAGHRLMRCGTLPDSGGVPATLTLTARAEDLAAGTGVAMTEKAEPIRWSTALRLLDQCDLFTTVLDANGAVLSLGRTQRCANRAQRRAVAARDGGCCFPGCTRPASWCQAHHVTAWQHGGLTNVDNLVLLCGWHHREFERRGWFARITNGVPEWVPPPWVDPDQVPMRNTAHHLPDFDFTTQSGARGP